MRHLDELIVKVFQKVTFRELAHLIHWPCKEGFSASEHLFDCIVTVYHTH